MIKDTDHNESPDKDTFLPTYTYQDEAGEKERKNIARELFFRQQDQKSAAIFSDICTFTQKIKKSSFSFSDMFDFLLHKGSTNITVEINLKAAINSVLSILSENKYAEIIYQNDNEDLPQHVTLHDPVILKIKNYILDFYGASSDFTVGPSQILKFFSFPCIAGTVSRLNVSAEKITFLSQSITHSEFHEHNLPPLSAEKHFYSLSFFDAIDTPVDIIFPSELPLNIVCKKILIPFLLHVQNTNLRMKDAIEGQFCTIHKMTPEIFSDIGTEKINPSSSVFFNWIESYKKIVTGQEFLASPSRFVSQEFLSAKTPQGKNVFYLLQAACMARHYLFNENDRNKKIKNETEAELKDKNIIFNFLIEKCRKKITHDTDNNSEYRIIHYPATIRDLENIKDITGTQTLFQKYNTEGIKKILSSAYEKNQSAEKKDAAPYIFRIVTDQETFYFHRWRLIDIFYSELPSEKIRVLNKLINQWVLLDEKQIPKESNFEIQEELLSPFFIQLYQLSQKICDAYPDIGELVKILFPALSDIVPYGLTQSDLLPQNRNGITNEEKLIHFRELIYLTSYDIQKKALKDVLEMNYKEVAGYVKKRKKTNQNKSQEPRFDNDLDAFIYRLLNGITGFFFRIFGFFSSSAPKKSKSSEPKLHAASNNQNKHTITVSDCASRFNTPHTREELKQFIDKLEKQWNIILIDPKSLYSEWDTLSFAQKEEYKKKLQLKL